MSKFSDLKKPKKLEFIDKASEYSEGKNDSNSERVTFSMTSEYISILQELAKRDRLSKSQIVRSALLSFSRLPKESRELLYDEIFAKQDT